MLAARIAAYPQAAQAPAQPALPAEEKPPVLAVPKEYRYSARGRRDPFVNPVPKPANAVPAPAVVRPPGLRGVMVSEAQIAGVVTSGESSMNVAIIGGPGVKTPYFARVGDHLFDGVVQSITLDTVIFSITSPDKDAKKPRQVVRQVRPKTGDNK